MSGPSYTKENTKRRWRLFPLAVQSCLEPLIAPAIKERGFAEARILTHWAEIVGPALAEHSRPMAIRGAAGGVRTLQVMVHPAFAMQLHYAHPVILERIATYVGFRAVGQVQMIQRAFGPAKETTAPRTLPPLLPAKPRAPEAAPMEEPTDPLEAALAGLAKALQERRALR